jgi:hypothetical protein
VPHGTVLRTALSAEPIDVRALATPDDVERGWDRQLDRGLRTELPDPWQTRVDHARVDVLLAPIDAPTLRALEDWGFDAEAAVAWERAPLRVRRAVRRRSRLDDVWSTLRACDPAAEPGRFLVQLRDALVRESRRAVELLPEFPVEWLGQQLAALDVPLRSGNLSFAIRWHGPRPALLWDAPTGTVLRVPGLDPEWSTTTAVGETLLAMPPAPLLAMGTTRREGDRVVDPESFG